MDSKFTSVTMHLFVLLCVSLYDRFWHDEGGNHHPHIHIHTSPSYSSSKLCKRRSAFLFYEHFIGRHLLRLVQAVERLKT